MVNQVTECASESEVKKAFRKLALKYHPDVCREKNGGVSFHQINEAYDIVMAKLKEAPRESERYETEDGEDREEAIRERFDAEDMWENQDFFCRLKKGNQKNAM